MYCTLICVGFKCALKHLSSCNACCLYEINLSKVLFVLIFQFEFYLLLLSMHVEIWVTCINFKLFSASLCWRVHMKTASSKDLCWRST
jgi:hypothetical protein